jgi:uncharacterized membrane protein YagU involved in acid resistance
MNWASWLLWGSIATLALSALAALAQGLGLTRMNIPYMLGTMFTPDRDRARLYGFFAHMGWGLAFSLVYVLIFESLGAATWWRGVIIGVAQALVFLLVVVSLLPGLHPRMASEQHGPSAQNLLEPPGFLALHYGIRTPIAVVLTHVLFGAILGAFYHLKA